MGRVVKRLSMLGLAMDNRQEQLGINDARLAIMVGVSERTIARWKRGDNRMHQTFRKQIVSILGIDSELAK